MGRPPAVPKYECHIKLKTKKDGPVIRSQLRLPHSVKTDIKICVICPTDSPAAKQAREAGAVLVGEEEVFEVIKSGKIRVRQVYCTAVESAEDQSSWLRSNTGTSRADAEHQTWHGC